MSGGVRLVWGEAFMRYRLSEDHPLQPLRVKLTVELIHELGLVELAELVPPRVAVDEELRLCHSRDYVELVRSLSEPDLRDGVAWLRAQGHRVACVDVDVHHGDGTQALFYADPEVLTVSIHESGRYLFPGTGFPDESGVGAGLGAAANLPLLPYTWDEPWLAAFEATVPTLLREFKPTILVTQDGCDSHYLDPLAHLQTSTGIWPRVGRRFHELAHELCEGRWVATGGGGYAVREVVPRAWTLLFAEMVEHPEMAAALIDTQSFAPPAEAQERVWAALAEDLRRLSEELGIRLSL